MTSMNTDNQQIAECIPINHFVYEEFIPINHFVYEVKLKYF
jgi:hypothetical protein